MSNTHRFTAHNQPPHWEGSNPTVRVGDELRTYEIQGDNGERLLCWEPTPTDLEVSPIAGWDKLPHRISPVGGQLVLPPSTRSAANVLSSMPAWATEKDETLAFMADYANEVYHKFGQIDISLSLDTVGVPRGRAESFIVPPHTLDNDRSTKDLWLDGVVHDLSEVLANDARAEELINGFVRHLSIGERG
jgi:hypothetical protein